MECDISVNDVCRITSASCRKAVGFISSPRRREITAIALHARRLARAARTCVIIDMVIMNRLSDIKIRN